MTDTLRSILSLSPAKALAQQTGNFWLPPRASTSAGDVDWVFNLIFWISLFFFALIVVLMIWFVIRYRRRPGVEPQQGRTSHMGLELTWTIIPTILVVVIFYTGFTGFMDLRVSPTGAYEVNVYARKWDWQFEYPNGVFSNELHVPVNEPVKLIMIAEDVIHSLYVPAFRIKTDLVPGRYTQAWFEATEPGEYVLYCAEYCGTGHSDMLSSVVVHKTGGFEKWLEDAANWMETVPLDKAGRILLMGDERGQKSAGCTQCHMVEGKGGNIGPPLDGLYGKERPLADGSTVVADENYIRESILEPDAKIVAGFKGGQMVTYQGRLKEREINAIIEYLKSKSGS